MKSRDSKGEVLDKMGGGGQGLVIQCWQRTLGEGSVKISEWSQTGVREGECPVPCFLPDSFRQPL